MNIRLLLTADLHCSRILINELTEAVDNLKPDVLCLAGDTVNQDAITSEEWCSPQEYAWRISQLNVPQILFSEGNHDVEAWAGFIQGWDGPKPLEILAPGIVQIGALKIGCMPCEISGADDSLTGYPHTESWIEQWLEENCTGPNAPQLWLLHEPPRNFGIASPRGIHVGSEFWRQQILRFHPPVVFTGHIHEWSFASGTWHVYRTGTHVINVGQKPRFKLSYCVMDVVETSTNLSFHITAPLFAGHISLEIPLG